MTESNKEGHMNTITKLLLVPAIVVAFSVGVALAASGGSGGGSAAQAPSTTDGTTTLDSTTTGTTTNGGVDISGPCDEAENRNDARCTGVAPAAGGVTTTNGGVDISGPCDEAENR